MRNNIAKTIDTLSLTFISGIIFFAWIRFYTKDYTLSLILAIILSLLLTTLINFLIFRKNEKFLLSKQEKSNAETLSLNLLCSPSSTILNYIQKIYSSLNYEIEKKTNYLILKQNSAQNEVHSTLHTLCFPHFKSTEFTLNDLYSLISIANQNDIKDLIIITISTTPETKSFINSLNNFNIKIIDQYEFYSKYAKDFPLPQQIDISKPKLNYKTLFKYSQNPKRAKNYLLFGIFTILTSFLVPYKLYYLITGTILCVIALILKLITFLPNKNKSN